MNYYAIAPSYLARLLMTEKLIKPANKLLNVGCGKGDYNYYLRDNFKYIVGIDINRLDISDAQKLNVNKRIKYFVMDSTKIRFKDNFFDTVICIDVLEHVKNKDIVLNEIHRVLKTNGQLIVSVPQRDFPFTYDPINKFLNLFNFRLSIGAYAFGHTNLPKVYKFKSLLERRGFRINKVIYLSHYLTCLMELYHVGVWQRLIKDNTTNSAEASRKSIVKYSYKIPEMAYAISKFIIKMDNFLFKNSKKSLGVMFDVTKI